MGELPNAPIPDSHIPQTDGLQMGGHRSSISCAVVEKPDHRCRDDFVNTGIIAARGVLQVKNDKPMYRQLGQIANHETCQNAAWTN